MPWKKSDVDKFITGLSSKQKGQWTKTANAILRECEDEEGCEAKAIRIANAQFEESMDFDSALQHLQEAGRKISKKNEQKLRDAITALTNILSQIETQESMTFQEIFKKEKENKTNLIEAIHDHEWHSNKSAILQDKVKELFPNANHVFVDDFSDHEVIFMVMNDDEPEKTFKAGFMFDEDGNITFGEPKEVVRQTIYVPANSEHQESTTEHTESHQELELVETAVTETTPVNLVEGIGKDGTMPIKIIGPGWGTSGYYTQEALKNGAKNYKKGTKMYLDHPTEEEKRERPERSVKDVAGVLTTDGEFKEDGKQGPGVYAHAKVYEDYQQFINERANDIGLSHIASGSARKGEAEGKKGMIIESIDKAKSVDFVTAAGADGKIIDMYESYRGSNNQTDNKMAEETENKELQEAKKENQKLKERLLMREAKDIVSEELEKSELPTVTKKRLAENLAGEYVENDKGEIDKANFKEKISKAVEEETEYLKSVTGKGDIKEFGESKTDEGDDKNKRPDMETWLKESMGYPEDQAKILAKGRN